jgi:AbrB family looped-hinge helix DNA binding protein
MEEAAMTSKGQIVVPARLRRRYGLKPGVKVYFIEREGRSNPGFPAAGGF